MRASAYGGTNNRHERIRRLIRSLGKQSTGLQSKPPPQSIDLLFGICHCVLYFGIALSHRTRFADLACSVPASAFKRLHEGMSYNEVAAVMGCDGVHKPYMSDAAPDMPHPSSTVTIDEYSWGGAEAGAGFVMADFYDGKLHDWKGMPPRNGAPFNHLQWFIMDRATMSVQQTALLALKARLADSSYIVKNA